MTSQAERAWRDMADPPLPSRSKNGSPATTRAGRAAYAALLQTEPSPHAHPDEASPWLLLRDSTRRRVADH